MLLLARPIHHSLAAVLIHTFTSLERPLASYLVPATSAAGMPTVVSVLAYLAVDQFYAYRAHSKCRGGRRSTERLDSCAK